MTQKQDRRFIVPISTSIQCALALLYRQAPIKVHIVLTMHDKIVLECPGECVEEAMGVLKDAMVQACREYLKAVCIPEPDVLEEVY